MDLKHEFHGCVCWDYVGGDRFAFLLCIGHLEPEQGGVLDGCVRHAGGFVGPWQAGLGLLVLDLLILLVLDLLVLALLDLLVLDLLILLVFLVLDLLVLDLLVLNLLVLNLLVLVCWCLCAAASLMLPL